MYPENLKHLIICNRVNIKKKKSLLQFGSMWRSNKKFFIHNCMTSAALWGLEMVFVFRNAVEYNDVYQNVARSDSEDKGAQRSGKLSCDNLNMRCFSPRNVGFIALDSAVHGGTGIEGLEGGKFQEVDLR